MKPIFIVLSIAASICSAAKADGNWPRLDRGAAAAECNEALEIAQAAFLSNEFYLFSPPTIPEGLKSTLVLEPDGLDISGGDALKGDAAVFDKLPLDRNGDVRSVY